MDVYSALLLVAMLAAGSALIGALVTRFRAGHAWLTRASPVAGYIGALAALLAVVHHVAAGHRPGTPTALSLGGFLALHPAPFITMVVGVAAGWLARARVAAPSRNTGQGAGLS